MRTTEKAPRAVVSSSKSQTASPQSQVNSQVNPAAKSPATPKDVAQDIADRAPFDRIKAQRTNRRAVQAADRLLKEMDDVLKHLERK